MRFFSGCRGRSRAGQLDYNTTGNRLCQHLFSVFSTLFSISFSLVDISSFPAIVGVSYHTLFFLSIQKSHFCWVAQFMNQKACTLTNHQVPVHAFFYMAAISLPNSCSRIHCRTFRSLRDTCTCVVPSTFAVSLWVFPP